MTKNGDDMQNRCTALASSVCLLALLVAGCSDPLVPRGDAGWSWRFSVTPEKSVREVAPVLKARLRAAGIKELKVYPMPPPTKVTPGSLVASELRVEVRGVAEEAEELILHLVTSPGRLGIHRVDESSRLLDEVYQGLSESDRREVEAIRDQRIGTTLTSPNGERLKAITARATREHAASGRSLAIQPPNELGQKPQFTAFVIYTEPELTNADVKSAKGLKGYDRPTVEITLTPAGLDTLSTLTRESVGKRLAIVIDDTVVNAPIVREPIVKGTLRLTFGRSSVSRGDADLMSRLWAFLIGLEPVPAKLALLDERAP